MNYFDELFGRNRLGAMSANFGVKHVLTYMDLDHFPYEAI
jgi:hypothetical protein